MAAARAVGFPFTLTARAENHIRGNPDLDDTMARLQAFESAGADVLYAPGLSDLNDIRALCAAVSKPVNVLARPNLTFQELADAGAQRVSVGGSLTWAAVQALVEAAERDPRPGQLLPARLGPARRLARARLKAGGRLPLVCRPRRDPGLMPVSRGNGTKRGRR